MIYVGDVLKLPLADASVDLVICSPPYEDARTYGIDFKLRGQDWVDWAVAGFRECLRVCRGLVAWVVGSGKRRKFRWSAVPALMLADLHRGGVILRPPCWFHRHGIPGSGGPDWLKQNIEWIVCATSRPGRLPWSDNKACGHPPKYAPGGEMSYRLSNGKRRNQWGGDARGIGSGRKPDGTLNKRWRPSHRSYTKGEVQEYAPPAIANPGNVIHCKVGGGLMGHPLAHENEAPFPEKLAEFFVRSFCRPGGIVLDPFSGSGTTAAVALANGRRFVAGDLRANQADLTRRRTAEVQLVCI